jgi:hypothetical protein
MREIAFQSMRSCFANQPGCPASLGDQPDLSYVNTILLTFAYDLAIRQTAIIRQSNTPRGNAVYKGCFQRRWLVASCGQSVHFPWESVEGGQNDYRILQGICQGGQDGHAEEPSWFACWFAVGLHRSLETPEKPEKIDLQLVCSWFALHGWVTDASKQTKLRRGRGRLPACSFPRVSPSWRILLNGNRARYAKATAYFRNIARLIC